ncbi:Plasmodium vivax Vir protein, putative [Plasmodium vivax]|nr:Plasmodium vivax Vir protein, putative [Plasmodium vivax]
MITETKDTYYNYDDYCFFKKNFENALYKADIGSIDQTNIIIKSIHSNIKDRFIKICATIKDYLSHSDINPLSDIKNPCNYINYYLRMELKDQIYYDKNDTFKNIKTYIQFGDKNKNNSCISKMEYIDNVTYNKMKKLYNLYDAYEAFLEQRINNDDLNNCNTLSEVIDEYNDIIKNNEYAKSFYLYKELKHIKCLIESDHLFYPGKCNPKLSEFTSPKGLPLEYEKPCKNNEKTSSGVTISLISGMTGMFGILLYKYTPVGNKLRHLIYGKSQISNNMHDEKYKLYINNFENETNDLDGRRYNVSYYSAGNS